MTVTKTMTDAALAANKANSQKSTGPRSKAGKEKSSRNALRHQLLANHFVLGSDEERLDFETLVDGIVEGLQPDGILEEMLAADIAITWRKRQMALALESAELLRRTQAPDNVVSAFLQSADVRLPIDELDPDGAGWEVQSLTLKAQADADRRDANSRRDVTSNLGNKGNPLNRLQARERTGKSLEIQAVLGTPIDRVLRYQAQLSRDFYRAIATFRRLQADRLGIEPAEE